MIKFIEVNGIKLAYDESGNENGKNVVLVHGLASSKEVMFPMRDSISDLYHVYTIDCRGHGESEKMANYDIQDLADDVIAFVKTLQLEDVTVLGYSMGSFITLRAAETEDVFDKIILVGTKGDSSVPAISNLLKSKGLSIEDVSHEEFGKLMMQSIFAPTTKLTKELMASRPKGIPVTQEERIAENKAIEDFDNLKDVDKVKAEAMVISAQYDVIVPPERGREVADALGCRFELLNDAGHMMMVEKPKELEDLIKDFVG